MWSRLKPTIIKELLGYLRDPATSRFLLVAPIIQTVLFAFAATLDVRNVDIAVFDQDAGRWSHELVARLDGAWFTDELIPVYDRAALDELISQRRVVLGLHLGPEFSRDIGAGQTGQVQLLLDGRRANTAQLAASYVQRIAGQMGAEIGASAGPSVTAGVTRSTATMEVRHRYNTNLNYRWFMVVNLTGVLAMMMCLVVTSLSIAREREMGTFDQLLVSPLSSLEIMLAKVIPGLVAGCVVSSSVSLIAVFGFGAPFAGKLLLLLPMLLLFTISVSGIGLLVSSVCQTQQQAILGTFLGSIPVVLTSGFATPIENMPEWLQYASQANPLRHYIVVVQGIFFKAQPAAVLAANAWPLLVIGVMTFSVATIVVRRKLE
jgi:ABC-2 type transport system permease protein